MNMCSRQFSSGRSVPRTPGPEVAACAPPDSRAIQPSAHVVLGGTAASPSGARTRCRRPLPENGTGPCPCRCAGDRGARLPPACADGRPDSFWSRHARCQRSGSAWRCGYRPAGIGAGHLHQLEGRPDVGGGAHGGPRERLDSLALGVQADRLIARQVLDDFGFLYFSPLSLKNSIACLALHHAAVERCAAGDDLAHPGLRWGRNPPG